tara:strand:+ start:37721 stop:38533 length:813 start_codon:yes stop_codon:yes gene_type:complete
MTQQVDGIAGQPESGFLEVNGVRLETLWIPGRTPGPTLVLLHEGLGCVATWRDFPVRLAAETGYPVFVYSRQGYGQSDACELPRPLSYMHDEGKRVLPEVLRAAGIDDFVLVGHSDGGSIALVYAGEYPQVSGLRAVITMAAHVFCEDITVASIEGARSAYEQGKLDGLRKYHGANTDTAFWGWNRAWLDPLFMSWNIEEFLPSIAVPLLVIQGREDKYGTLAQVDAIAAQARGPVATCLLENCDHWPHKEQPALTLSAIGEFLEANAAR